MKVGMCDAGLGPPRGGSWSQRACLMPGSGRRGCMLHAAYLCTAGRSAAAAPVAATMRGCSGRASSREPLERRTSSIRGSPAAPPLEPPSAACRCRSSLLTCWLPWAATPLPARPTSRRSCLLVSVAKRWGGAAALPAGGEQCWRSAGGVQCALTPAAHLPESQPLP